MGLGNLSEEHLDILMDTADFDNNGKFSLKNYRAFAPFADEKKVLKYVLITNLKNFVKKWKK